MHQRHHHQYSVYYFKDRTFASKWKRVYETQASLKMQTRDENVREGAG